MKSRLRNSASFVKSEKSIQYKRDLYKSDMNLQLQSCVSGWAEFEAVNLLHSYCLALRQLRLHLKHTDISVKHREGLYLFLALVEFLCPR